MSTIVIAGDTSGTVTFQPSATVANIVVSFKTDGTTDFSDSISTSGQIVSNATYSSTSGNIVLNSATGNRIDFNTSGTAAPSYTTRSVGTKIVLYPGISAIRSDYAIGMDASTLWNSVPDLSATFKWYNGTYLTMQLFPTGHLSLNGLASWNQGVSISSSLTTSAYQYGIVLGPTTDANCTNYFGIQSSVTLNASATLSTVAHFFAYTATGAPYEVTTHVGFLASASLANAAGAINTFGFRGQINGPSSGNYNLYMDGTADNFLKGATTIGSDLYVENTLSVTSTIISYSGMTLYGGSHLLYDGLDAINRHMYIARSYTQYYSELAGAHLYISAGGASVASTNLAGGSLVLRGGLSTGNSTGSIYLQGCLAGVSGQQDNPYQSVITVTGNKLGFYNVTPVVRAAAPTAAVAAPPASAGTFGWGSAADKNTAVAAINNLMTRMTQVENILSGVGLSL